MKRTIADTELHTWFERDRQHVELRDKKTGKTLVEWWDEAVSEAVEDGFLNPRRFHESAFDYFQKEMGGKPMRKKNPRKRRASPAQLKARAKFAAAARSGKFRRRRKVSKSRKALLARRARQRKAAGIPEARSHIPTKRNPARAPMKGFQVAALRQGKILFLSGVAMTTGRDAASNFSSVSVARKVAKQVRDVGGQLGISKVAVVTRHDAPAEIRRFLLGEA